jgi:hypothetical protein
MISEPVVARRHVTHDDVQPVGIAAKRDLFGEAESLLQHLRVFLVGGAQIDRRIHGLVSRAR